MLPNEKTLAEIKAEEELKKAKERFLNAKNEGNKKRRKEQDRFKYMLGGIVVKWFPEVYDYSEREMNRIISGAFKNSGVKTLIQTVLSERPNDEKENKESTLQNADSGQTKIITEQ